MHCLRRVFPAICVWLIPQLLAASVTLPLQGFCRPGRYFPVKIDGVDCQHAQVFSAAGCLPCSIDSSASSATIFPVLVTGDPHELTWTGGHAALRVPEADERLVAGLEPTQIQAAAVIFPGARLLPIALDSGELLPGSPAAWEALDAVVLPTDLCRRIADPQRSALLAGGVKLIATGETAPDAVWPWRRAGSVWVLDTPIAGPGGESIDENAYAPTFNWSPGWSPAVRGQVFGVGVLLVLVVAGLSLRPTPVMQSVSIAVMILATAEIVRWRQVFGSVDRAGGDIIVADHGLLQCDAFVYERAREDSTRTVPWSGSTHPLFASPAAMQRSQMQLHVSGEVFGEVAAAFTYQAKAGHTMAFVHREIRPGILPVAKGSTQSPMWELAGSDYLDSDSVPGRRIVGETAPSGNRWATILIAPR